MIAARLGRAPSTVSCEVVRNGGGHRYRAHRADRKPSKLAEHRELGAVVEDKLADWWSPQQVARWLRRTYLENQEMAARYQHRLQGKVVGADESSTEREPKGRAGAER